MRYIAKEIFWIVIITILPPLVMCFIAGSFLFIVENFSVFYTFIKEICVNKEEASNFMVLTAGLLAAQSLFDAPRKKIVKFFSRRMFKNMESNAFNCNITKIHPNYPVVSEEYEKRCYIRCKKLAKDNNKKNLVKWIKRCTIFFAFISGIIICSGKSNEFKFMALIFYAPVFIYIVDLCIVSNRETKTNIPRPSENNKSDMEKSMSDTVRKIRGLT